MNAYEKEINLELKYTCEKVIIPNLKYIGEKAINLLYPMVCPLCGRILPFHRQAFSSREKKTDLCGKESETNPYICPSCYAKLIFPEEPRCLKCSRPLMEETEEYCQDCAGSVRYFDWGRTLLMHDDSAKKILYDLKYRNKRDNARMLAREAADRMHAFVKRWDPDVVIPVPLHRKRELARGFNQSELLAKHLTRELKNYGLDLVMDPGYLIRVKRTSAQKELSREQRRANIRGAFEVSYKVDPAKYEGRTILLIDDIYTSGATLSECARVLKEAGAGNIYFLTFSIG